MKRFVAIFCVFSLAAVVRPAEKPEQPGPIASPLLEKGPFQEIRKPLEPIFAFTFDGERLKIDRRHWARAAAKGRKPNPLLHRRLVPPIVELFGQIAATVGAGSRSEASIGDDRTINFGGGKVLLGLRLRGDTIRMALEESESPNRTLVVRDDGQGALALQLIHPDGAVLLLNQARGGRFSVAAVAGDQVLNGRGDTFLACFRKHRKAMETQVLPVLEHYGIQLFLSPQSPQVRQAVLTLLARTPEALAEGRRLLDELDGNNFATREKAGQRLSERFALYEDLIRQKLVNKPSLELKRRLEAILEEHADAPRVSQTVAALNLLQDAGFLVSLLDKAEAEEVARLVGQLEKVTGQKLGTDPAAWKEWAKKDPK